MEEPAIIVKDLGKEFLLPQHKHTSLKQVFVNIWRRNKKVKQKALTNINFEVKKGEFFGIVGRNGSGKSTLLKILAGVYTPTTGGVIVNGKLTPFIELGVGFNPELSGRDNVFLNGALLGFSHKEMAAMYKEIVNFAELREFMDQKLKNYSSGMQVRLAFSIAIRAKSDILLIDEVLAVGDENFQKKCFETFENLKREGRTIVFVSHAMSSVRDFCNRVAVINEGHLIFVGQTEKGIDIYNQLNAGEEDRRLNNENKKQNDLKRIGNGKAIISEYKLLNNKGKKALTLESGENFEAYFEITANELVTNCAVGVMFRKNPQENLYGINTYHQGHRIEQIEPGKKVRINLRDKLPLSPGAYFVSFQIASMTKTGYDDLDNLSNIMKINVVGPNVFWGLINTKPEIHIG